MYSLCTYYHIYTHIDVIGLVLTMMEMFVLVLSVSFQRSRSNLRNGNCSVAVCLGRCRNLSKCVERDDVAGAEKQAV